MSYGWNEYLRFAGLASFIGAVALLSEAQMQAEAQTSSSTVEQSSASASEKKSTPIEETKPFEQTRDAGDGIAVPEYRDDRSTPEALIESYYNAINRKEYARAYSYYSEEGREPEFETYAKGYAETKSVKLAVRKTEPDPGAGQIYWSLPIAIEAERNDGGKQVFSGCYTIRMSNPAMQEMPPYKPMQIMTGSLTKSPLSLEKSVPETCEAP